MTLLADRSDYESRHGAYTGDGQQLVQLLDDASSLVRQIAKTHITYVEDDELVLDGDGSRLLFLPDVPVRGVTSVEIDGVAQTTDQFRWWSWGGLDRNGASFPFDQRCIEVVYSHGEDVVPGWVVSQVCSMVQRALRPAALEGVQSHTTGSQTIAYISSAAGVNLWLTKEEARRLEGLRGPTIR